MLAPPPPEVETAHTPVPSTAPGAEAASPAPSPPAASVVPPAPVSPRALPAPSARAQELHQLAAKLGAPGARVENPSALKPFFTSLDSLAAGSATAPTVVEAFGNSLIAGDRIVDIIREDLSAAFGNAGRGALLVDRMAPYGGRGRTGLAYDGWQPRTLGELRAPPYPFGITGVYHVATRARASSRFVLDGEPRGTLWWLDVPRGGRLSVVSGGQVLARTEPTGDGAAHALTFEFPPGTKSFDVIAEKAGAVVLHVVLQQARPGVVLDMLGVPSADATLFLRAREDILHAQLAERDPRLMLFFLGGNEAKRLEWKRLKPEVLRNDLATFLHRARTGAPGSACMVVGPIDAVQDRKGKDKPRSEKPYLDVTIAAEREVALAEGCAFLDVYAAMGGDGSLLRFYKAGMVHEDLVHPRGKGLDLLGQFVVDALLRAWVEDSKVDVLEAVR